MGVLKKNKPKNEKDIVKKNYDAVNKKDVANGKSKSDGKVKKKKMVSCLQCIKSSDDGGLEGKYRVAAPELMQDTFMSDSEDEGGEVECPIQQQQQYRYMNSEAGTLHRAKPLEDSVTDGHLWPSNNDSKVATIDRQPLDIGFLVSFVVDARGGAMKAKRRGGVRIIVPPAACAAPTRVTCRAATRRAPVAAPPPLMEGEALASRLLELQPQGAKFLAPVIIEVPIYTSSCREREIVILRSDTGETWQDHYLHNNDNPMIQEALQRERQEHGPGGESLGENGERVCRIVTCDFPHYLACVSRVRQEVHIIGPEGGTVSSAHTPQVQALFPAQALTKRIRVGLQAHGAAPAACRRVLPRHAAVSPVVTVEPRRRKFHRSITLTAPLPHQEGKLDKQSSSNLRLLCSIMGGQARAVWEDVTGSTPLTITEDCASFTTTVSARFWMMYCQNVSDATKFATELYREMLLVPFEVRIVVLGKRLDALEGRLLVLYITDRYAYDTLLQQEHYTEVAHSTAVQFLDGKEIYLEFSGNLVPVTKSGSQPVFAFESFKDNRVEFTVRVKHHEESPSGRIYFMNEPKVAKGEQSQTPTCVLDVQLPDGVAPRAAKSHTDCLNLDQSGFDALKDELSFHWGDHNNSLGPISLPPVPERQLNGHDKIITNGDVKYPAKEDEENGAKPQLNGDSFHVDSNKTKATFDSDEDKTPMNTLEKGKKKAEGGFFGGIAGKVKNVFGHSEDKDDDVKESSPKPQPKPREAKDKTPPKPAPRIINEDLLDKVDDMFKDLHSKPHRQDEDLESQVYATKLVVDEDRPSGLQDIKEDLYEQYANMQPVETPQVNKTSDPFAFYIDCCEGRFKGQKHSHDETSNLVDRIENVKFTAHEKLAEAGDRVQDDVKEGLDKLENEKDNLKQKSGEVKEEIIVKTDKIKGDITNKENELKAKMQGKLNDIKQSANEKYDDTKNSTQKVQDNVNAKAAKLEGNIYEEVDHIKSSAKDSVDHLKETADGAKSNLKDSAHELDFAAREKAEELKLRTQDGVKAVGDSIHNVQENLNHKAHDLKAGANETAENVKGATNEKIHELGESIDNAKSKAKNAKDEAKSKAKKKGKEGKGFLTGLVSNIFGEKDKIESEVKGKISEGKDSANNLAEKAAAKKDEIKNNVVQKQDELKEGADILLQNAQAKTDEAAKAISTKKDDVVTAIHDKTEDVKSALNEKKAEITDGAKNVLDQAAAKKHELEDSVVKKHVEIKEGAQNLLQSAQVKKDEAAQAISEKKSEAASAIQDKADEAKNTLHDKQSEIENAVHNKTDEAKKALQNKKEQLESAVHDTTDAAKKAVEDKKESLIAFGSTIEGKANDAKQAIHDTKSDVEQTICCKTNELQQAVHDKTDEAKQAIQDKKSEVTEGAKNLLDQASAKKHEFEDGLSKKNEELKEGAGNLLQSAYAKKDEVQREFYNVTDGSIQAAHDTKDAIAQGIHDKTHEIGLDINNKKNEIGDAIQSKQDEVRTAAASKLDRIRQEAEQTTEQIKKSAEDTLNAAADKKAELQSNIGNKMNEIQKSGKETIGNAQQAVSDKASDLQRSSKEAFDHVQDSALSSFDKVESSAKDKVSDARDTWEDLQSSTRDTFADFKDDAYNWENSAQDTLHSFQSSASNTFDSLDDSARELMGGVHGSAQNAESHSRQLFGDVQDSFEGFQVSADNKLRDVKGSTNERLEEAGERLGEAREGLKEDARGAEQAVLDAVSGEADKFTSSLNDLGNSVFGSSGQGFMKDSSSKLLESEKSQSSPHKKGSGIPKLKRKNKK